MTEMEVKAVHSMHIRLLLAREHRQQQIAEAAEHRLGRSARPIAERASVRRGVGRSLIRLGRALAAEPDQALQPAQPR